MNSKIVILALFSSLCGQSNAQDLSSDYFGNVSFETVKFGDKGVDDKLYGTRLEVFSKESPLKYEFGFYRGYNSSDSGDIFYINSSYRVGLVRAGISLRNDDLGKFSDRLFTYAINTESDSDVVPYAFGHLGMRDFKGKGDAGNYMVRVGLRKGLYSFEIEKKLIGSAENNPSVSGVTLNPRAEFLLGNSGNLYFEVNYQKTSNSGIPDYRKVDLAEFSIKWLADKYDVAKFTLFNRVVASDLNQKSNASGVQIKYSKYF